MRAIPRWLVAALLVAGCSCEDEAESLAAEGFVRCHMASPPEGDRRLGDRTLRFEDRTLTIDGLPDTVRVAVAAGPLGGEPPAADLYVVLGGLARPPELPRGDAPVLAIAGGADVWERWREAVGDQGDTRNRIIDATSLRLVRAGPVELVPVAGAPPRYAATDRACGRAAADADAWALDDPRSGVTRVLVSWAAAEATGLLGAPAGDPSVDAIRASARASAGVHAWPREDAAAIRPASGPWIVRADGSREAPGWTVFEAGPAGWSRQPARLDSGRGAD